MAKRRETRADLIAALKSRGIKGKLSKNPKDWSCNADKREGRTTHEKQGWDMLFSTDERTTVFL